MLRPLRHDVSRFVRQRPNRSGWSKTKSDLARYLGVTKGIPEQYPAPRAVPTGWSDVILICKKCSKKLDGGFGPARDLPLRKTLRAALRAEKKRHEIGLIEVGCFGICPKRAVTIARSSKPGELLVVPEGYLAESLMEQITRDRLA